MMDAKSTRESVRPTQRINGPAPWYPTIMGTAAGPRFALAPPRARAVGERPQRARHAPAAWQNARLAALGVTLAARVV